SVGELEGQLGSGKASPTPHEAFRREESELFAHSGLHRDGHQQVKLRVLVDLIEEFLGEVLCVGQDQHAGGLWLKNGTCQLEQCRSGLWDSSGRCPGRKTDRLGRIRIEDKEGLSHLSWAGSVVFAMATHLAFAVAA